MDLNEQKQHLIKELIEGGYLKSKKIIDAFRSVKRENFIPKEFIQQAYANYPLPIMEGQTISQPLTIAFMTETLRPKRGDKILEVGSGSGYQSALLAEIVGSKGKVVTTERLWSLVEFARKNLSDYENVEVVLWDGTKGYEPEAPYDSIIVTASAPAVPEPLVEQLKPGGRLVIPVGSEMMLIRKKVRKDAKGASRIVIDKQMLGYFVFVPLIGKHGYRK